MLLIIIYFVVTKKPAFVGEQQIEMEFEEKDWNDFCVTFYLQRMVKHFASRAALDSKIWQLLEREDIDGWIFSVNQCK